MCRHVNKIIAGILFAASAIFFTPAELTAQNIDLKIDAERNLVAERGDRRYHRYRHGHHYYSYPKRYHYGPHYKYYYNHPRHYYHYGYPYYHYDGYYYQRPGIHLRFGW